MIFEDQKPSQITKKSPQTTEKKIQETYLHIFFNLWHFSAIYDNFL